MKKNVLFYLSFLFLQFLIYQNAAIAIRVNIHFEGDIETFKGLVPRNHSVCLEIWEKKSLPIDDPTPAIMITKLPIPVAQEFPMIFDTRNEGSVTLVSMRIDNKEGALMGFDRAPLNTLTPTYTIEKFSEMTIILALGDDNGWTRKPICRVKDIRYGQGSSAFTQPSFARPKQTLTQPKFSAYFQ
ncbi:MAG: hypothetical protein JSR85_02325 [Proteobacteria bacterium]|nr:hypothetical protein [Pseudomonadota bacterium]